MTGKIFHKPQDVVVSVYVTVNLQTNHKILWFWVYFLHLVFTDHKMLWFLEKSWLSRCMGNVFQVPGAYAEVSN